MINSTITTKRLFLTTLDGEYCNMVSEFLSNNKDFFAPYETLKNEFYYSPTYQKNVLDTEYDAFTKRQYLRYYIFLKEDPTRVIGTVSFGNITPFPYCQATLGYKIDREYTNKRYATEAVSAAILEAFKLLKLHRIQAYVLEDNIPSTKLLHNLGFTYEGLCMKNINVCGVWKSHNQFAILNPNE